MPVFDGSTKSGQESMRSSPIRSARGEPSVEKLWMQSGLIRLFLAITERSTEAHAVDQLGMQAVRVLRER